MDLNILVVIHIPRPNRLSSGNARLLSFKLCFFFEFLCFVGSTSPVLNIREFLWMRHDLLFQLIMVTCSVKTAVALVGDVDEQYALLNLSKSMRNSSDRSYRGMVNDQRIFKINYYGCRVAGDVEHIDEMTCGSKEDTAFDVNANKLRNMQGKRKVRNETAPDLSELQQKTRP